MPDFDNDEIRDSSFPVEFNDETEALDMYGVWVKSGPRDVSSLDDEDTTDSDSSADTVLPVFSDVPDITEFEELPDMEDFESDDTEQATADEPMDESAESPEIATESDDFEFGDISFEEFDTGDEVVESPVVDEVSADDDIIASGSESMDNQDNIEEIVPVEDKLPDDTAEPVMDTAPEQDIDDFDISLESIDDSSFDDVAEEDVLEDELEIAVDPEASPPDMAESPEDPTMVEPADDADEPVDLESIDDEPSESGDFDSFEIDEASFAELDEESADKPEPVEAEAAETAEDVPAEAEAAETAEELPAESESTEDKPAEAVEADPSSFAELDPDLADFSMEDFAGIADMVNSAQNDSESSDTALPDEDDFSSLLDDINSGSAPAVSTDSSGLDDLDLDDFINEINESGGSSEKEKEKLFSDVEPVDMDLEFDEEFIENSEKIRATGSLISEAEFENSEFGVEFVDETDSDDEMDGIESFDSEIFSSADEEASDQSTVVPVQEDSNDNLEVASEFDDLLASLDSSHPAAPGPSESGEEKIEQEFNLQVTEEDGLESVSNSTPEMDDSDEFNVPLFSESPESESGGGNTVPEEEFPTVEEHPSQSEEDHLSQDEEPEKVDISSLEEYVSENEDITIIDENSSDNDNAAVSMDYEPDSMDQYESDFEDILIDSEPVSSSENVEIVEKDNLEITGESDYNEDQPGISDSDKGSMSMDFDDVRAFEESLHESGTETGETDVTSNDKSTELLMLIAEELSSIKKELSTLNSELSTTMKPVPQSDEENPDSVSTESGDNTGFFSDDDTDETIALTGDELNNILITADFTEEKTEEPDKDEFRAEQESEGIEDFTVDVNDTDEDESIATPESSGDESGEDVTADFNPVDEADQFDDITFDDAVDSAEPEELDIPDVLSEDDMFGTSGNIADNVEVSFVNKVDEDISYLEGDESTEPDLENVAIEESDIETLDFNDENLEEPELTEFNIDFASIEDSIGLEKEQSAESEDGTISSGLEEAKSEDAIEEPATEESGIEQSVVEESPAEEPVPEESPVSDENKESVVMDTGVTALPVELKDEIKSVLSYMDQLLESLPEEKIEEFARSEHFDVYKKLFEELGIT